MRLPQTSRLFALLAVTLLISPAALLAQDFNERLAAWNVGPVRRPAGQGQVAQATYQEAAPTPAADSDAAAPATQEPAAPAPAVGRGSPEPARAAKPAAPRPMSAPQPAPYYNNGYHDGGASCGASCGPACGGDSNCCRPFGGLFACLFPCAGHYAAASCGAPACGPGCDTCGGGEYGNACGGQYGGGHTEMCCGKPLWWARFDVLLWWREGRDLPPLVTTDPTSEDSTTAGILPDATILLGNGRLASDMAAGGRFDIGFWCDPSQCCGIGDRFFGLGRDGTRFHVDSLDNPILAMPFVNLDDDANDALLIAYPGLSTGSIDVTGSSGVLGNDLYVRRLWCRDCDSRIDFIWGYHFSRINDDLRINSSRTVTETGGSIPLGTVTTVSDNFSTRNEFHGAIFGLMHERDCGGCWTWQALGKIAIGSMHEEVIIDGSTTIAIPQDDPTTTAGGLFTGDSNIGTFSRSEFTAVTELGLTLNYKWGPCTRLSVGYTFIYWNDVLRPGDAIDPRVGTDASDRTHPLFAFNHGDYWVQGINLGLVREF